MLGARGERKQDGQRVGAQERDVPKLAPPPLASPQATPQPPTAEVGLSRKWINRCFHGRGWEVNSQSRILCMSGPTGISAIKHLQMPFILQIFTLWGPGRRDKVSPPPGTLSTLTPGRSLGSQGALLPPPAPVWSLLSTCQAQRVPPCIWSPAQAPA